MPITEEEGGTQQGERSQEEASRTLALILGILAGLYSYVRSRTTDPGGDVEGGGFGGSGDEEGAGSGASGDEEGAGSGASGGGGGEPPAGSQAGGGGEDQGSSSEEDPLLDLARRLREGSEHDRLLAFLDTVDMLVMLSVAGGPFLAGWTMHRQFARAVAEAHQRDRPPVHALTPEELAGAGLSGQQLNVKLEGLATALEEFSRAGGRRRFGRALRWARTLLDSLSAIVPGLHLVKELVETLENMGSDLEETDREFRR